MAPNGDVILSSQAFVAMVSHCLRHGTTVVHGVLLGNRSGKQVTISQAVPICHETPTQPLVDTSLGLVQSAISGSNDNELAIVGWFTAPELKDDTKPGPAALRIAANMATADEKEPVLVVLRNKALGQIFKGENVAATDVISALGKDFGQQWLQPLNLVLEDETKAMEAAKRAQKTGLVLNDLVDHWNESSSSEWYPSPTLTNFMKA